MWSSRTPSVRRRLRPLCSAWFRAIFPSRAAVWGLRSTIIDSVIMAAKKADRIESDLVSVPIHSDSTAEGTDGVSPQDEVQKKTPFNDEELEYFRGLIEERRTSAHEDIEQMRAQLEDAREQAEIGRASCREGEWRPDGRRATN